MATVSSHTLNSVDGTHASGIPVTLVRLGPDGSRKILFETTTDEGGRLMQNIDPDDVLSDASYELVLQTAAYFDAQNLPRPGMQVMRDTVLRFEMPDPEARYHMPFMLAPNSYSVWISSGPTG